MNEYIIETILGLMCGICIGVTGIAPMGIVLILLNYLKIGDYISNMGALLFINLFPITIGSVYEYYKSDKINYSLGLILLFSIMLGSYIGSNFVVGKGFKLSTKQIKYISGMVGLIMFILFFISAYYEKN